MKLRNLIATPVGHGMTTSFRRAYCQVITSSAQEDYFLGSQDPNEEWLGTIHVYKAIAINDSVMVVPVNFAGDKPEYTSRLVFLGKEAGELRIIKVERAVHWSE